MQPFNWALVTAMVGVLAVIIAGALAFCVWQIGWGRR